MRRSAARRARHKASSPAFRARRHHHHDHPTDPARAMPAPREQRASDRGVIVKSWERSHAITAARMPSLQKLVLFVVSDHCDGDDRCFLGLRRIAAEVGVVKNTARKAIDAVVAAGWLEEERRSHDARGTPYRFHVPANAAHERAPATSTLSPRARRLRRAVTVSRHETPAKQRTVSPDGTVETAVTVSRHETVAPPSLSHPTSAHCLTPRDTTVSPHETKRDLNQNGMVGSPPSQDSKAGASESATPTRAPDHPPPRERDETAPTTFSNSKREQEQERSSSSSLTPDEDRALREAEAKAKAKRARALGVDDKPAPLSFDVPTPTNDGSSKP